MKVLDSGKSLIQLPPDSLQCNLEILMVNISRVCVHVCVLGGGGESGDYS